MNKPFIIAVNAVSGGGKTAVTKALSKRLPNAKALYFDDRDYDVASGIEDICDFIQDGADVNRFDLSLLAKDIRRLIREKPDFILLDYPFDYRHRQIAGYIDCSVFIDTPLDIAQARRILRDYTTASSNEILEDMKHYLERGRDAYLHGLEETKAAADIVVDGSLPIEPVVRMIAKKLIERKNGTL